MISLYLAA